MRAFAQKLEMDSKIARTSLHVPECFFLSGSGLIFFERGLQFVFDRVVFAVGYGFGFNFDRFGSFTGGKQRPRVGVEYGRFLTIRG
jgi:hypothetical protein